MTPADIERMARAAGLGIMPGWISYEPVRTNLDRFASLVRAAALEEAARACEAEGTDPPADTVDYSEGFIHGANCCAAAIRSLAKEPQK